MMEKTFLNPATNKEWRIEIDGHTIRTCLNGGKVKAQKRPSTRLMPMRWSRAPLIKRCSMRRLVFLTTRALRKASSVRSPLSASLPFSHRRLGKRRLLALEESIEQELDWVRAFYVIRMQAEELMEKE